MSYSHHQIWHLQLGSLFFNNLRPSEEEHKLMFCSNLCFIFYFPVLLHDLKKQAKNCQNIVRGDACKI